MSDLEYELKVLIIESLGLEDLRPEDIESDEPLFNGGIDLDSIDALELELTLRKTYDFAAEIDGVNLWAHLTTIRGLAEFLRSRNRPARPV